MAAKKIAKKTAGKQVKPAVQESVVYHKDGTIWARGNTLDGEMTGYWEWFRKDGTKLRSGHFERGEQVSEWITYDKKGQKYKVTQIKPRQKIPARCQKNVDTEPVDISAP